MIWQTETACYFVIFPVRQSVDAFFRYVRQSCLARHMSYNTNTNNVPKAMHSAIISI